MDVKSKISNKLFLTRVLRNASDKSNHGDHEQPPLESYHRRSNLVIPRVQVSKCPVSSLKLSSLILNTRTGSVPLGPFSTLPLAKRPRVPRTPHSIGFCFNRIVHPGLVGNDLQRHKTNSFPAIFVIVDKVEEWNLFIYIPSPSPLPV